MITALDTRYAKRIRDLRINKYAGETNFIYYMYLWSIAYSNLFHDFKLRWADAQLNEEGKEKLAQEVATIEETETQHQMTALIKILNKKFPNRRFHYGITSEDIMHNARWTQVYFLMEHIENLVHDVYANVISAQRNDHVILEFTHGQPATPVILSKFLQSKFVEEFIEDYTDKIRYRIGGSNGQSPIINLSKEQVRELEKEMQGLLGNSGFESKIVTDGITQVGPSNGEVLAFMAFTSLRCRNLAKTYWDHASRGILRIETASTQTGSSAMPHKVNPIRFENAEGNFTLAYHGFLTMLEANSESRGLRDLSNSVVNRNLCEPFIYMILGLSSMKEGLKTSRYSREYIIKEMESHPECLTEFVRYRKWEEEQSDSYFDLKNNPPSNLQMTLNEEKDNRFIRHVYQYVVEGKL